MKALPSNPQHVEFIVEWHATRQWKRHNFTPEQHENHALLVAKGLLPPQLKLIVCAVRSCYR